MKIILYHALADHKRKIFAHAQPAFKFWQFLHGYPNACWANAETISLLAEHTTISLHTEPTQNEFWRMLSQHSNFDSFYMDIQTHAEPTRKRFHRWLRMRGNDFIAGWAYEETISSLTEHTRKRFIACWANAEKISSLAEHTRTWKRFHSWLTIRGVWKLNS
jgi:hypothetical protein